MPYKQFLGEVKEHWNENRNLTVGILYSRKAGDCFDDEQLVLEVPMDRYQLSQELQTLLEERLKAFNNLAMAQVHTLSNTLILTFKGQRLSFLPKKGRH